MGGGEQNTALGDYSTVPGGFGNFATASDSFAAGVSASATNTGSFVWNGNVDALTTSTNNYSFTVRAQGGARFLSSTSNTVGAILVPGGTTWSALSDSNAKTDIEPINNREVLQKVAALPVTSWHYKHDLKRRYIGPMAQDFHARSDWAGTMTRRLRPSTRTV